MVLLPFSLGRRSVVEMVVEQQEGGGFNFLQDDSFEQVSDSIYRGVKTLMLDHSASLDDYDCYSCASLTVPAFRFENN